MGNFFNTIKTFFGFETSTSNSSTISSPPIEIVESSNQPVSSSSIFVEGLVPINMARWPAYIAGSCATSEMTTFPDNLETVTNNIEVMFEYLARSKSDIQWRDRAWTVLEDTATINILSQAGGDFGAFYAGAFANQCADKYMMQQVETDATLNEIERLNLRIFERVAAEQGIDFKSKQSQGTGLLREFVPEASKGDFCVRPERGARPKDFFSDDGMSDDGISPGSKPKFPNPNSPSFNDGNSKNIDNNQLNSQNFNSFNDFPSSDSDVNGPFAIQKFTVANVCARPEAIDNCLKTRSMDNFVENNIRSSVMLLDESLKSQTNFDTSVQNLPVCLPSDQSNVESSVSSGFLGQLLNPLVHGLSKITKTDNNFDPDILPSEMTQSQLSQPCLGIDSNTNHIFECESNITSESNFFNVIDPNMSLDPGYFDG